MRTRITMVIALSFAACGGGGEALRVDDSRLIRLSAEARQAILDDERPVRVAEINLDGARVAARDARSFQSIVDNERNAAKQQLEAARKTLKLAESANDSGMASQARADESSAEKRVRAADAKAEYARQLVTYRDDVVKQREAELEAARAELEVRKVTQLAAAGQAEGLDQKKFDRAAIDARKRAGEARKRAEGRRDSVEERRASWQAVRVSGAGIDDAPVPPSALEDVR